MAKQTFVQLTDDLDGSEAAEELTFALRGQEFEIDLSAKNVAALEKALSKYIAASRKVPRSGGRRRAPRTTSRAARVGNVREWARANGFEISSRGRVPRTIQEAYEAARS